MSNGDKSVRPEPGFDDLLDRLQKVVGKLEAGNLGLEESLASYEEGVGLARQAHAVLDAAEKRVELLVSAGAAGVQREPFDRSTPTRPDDEAP